MSSLGLGAGLCPPCSQRRFQAVSPLRNLVLLHGFLAISSAAPTPCQGDFSSLPVRPLSPSSPGLSPLYCCGHALDTATLRTALLPKTWPPTSPCDPHLVPTQLLKVSSTVLALHPPRPPGPPPIDLPSLPASVLGFEPKVLHLAALHIPPIPSSTSLPALPPSLRQAQDGSNPLPCSRQPGGRQKNVACPGRLAPYEHVPSGLTWASPAACGLRHYTQNAFNLLHAPLTSSSQLTTASHFAEKTEASHQQLPPSLGTKPTEQLRPR